MAAEYWTVGQKARIEINIERSVFIAHAAPAESESEAKAFVARIRQEYADATHNCYAYRVGTGENPLTYYNDHGEPTGTAGKPILNAILQADITQTVVVVTRYFGGKKLGVRGLIDAYHQAAADVLTAAGRRRWIEWVEWEIALPYALWTMVQRHLDTVQGGTIRVDYVEDVRCRIRLPLENTPVLRAALSGLTDVIVNESPN